MPLSHRTLALVVTLVLLGSTRLQAEETPTSNNAPTWQLSFKFSADQLVRYQDNYHSTIQLQKADTKVRILNNRESRKHYRVLSVDQEGQGLVETVIDHIKIHAQQGDEPVIKIDSSDTPESCPADFRPLLATVGRPIARSRCNTSGKLIKVVSISKTWLKANPGNSNQSLAKSLQKQGFLVPLPDEPIATGDTWEESLDATTADKVGKRHGSRSKRSTPSRKSRTAEQRSLGEPSG